MHKSKVHFRLKTQRKHLLKQTNTKKAAKNALKSTIGKCRTKQRQLFSCINMYTQVYMCTYIYIYIYSCCQKINDILIHMVVSQQIRRKKKEQVHIHRNKLHVQPASFRIKVQLSTKTKRLTDCTISCATPLMTRP